MRGMGFLGLRTLLLACAASAAVQRAPPAATSRRRPFMAANWKMNPTTEKEARDLAQRPRPKRLQL